MKRIFKRIKKNFSLKEDSPPPYVANDGYAIHDPLQDFHDQAQSFEALDLLANCKISADDSASSVEYAEIQDMGIFHSTPLPGRNKSKISLTWVLKDLENARQTKEPTYSGEKSKYAVGAEVNRYQRHNQRFNENERQRKCKRIVPKDVKERVVGRNEYYNNYKFKVNSVCEDFNNGGQDTCSEDTSVGTGDYGRRRHRHKHRRRKSRPTQSGRFGYDIRDVDCFLSEASIDRPGNIPVVVAYPSILYQTQSGVQNEMELPLGTVVNAVFKNKQWLYVQTPHADEGYVLYAGCLPLGILPNRSNSPQKKTPCWESSTDIYPRPCGNLTDTEKEQLRGRTRSECRYRATERRYKTTKSLCGEEQFDNLYMKSKSVSNINRNVCETKESRRKKLNHRQCNITRHTLLVVNCTYIGNSINNTISVQKGDVVILIQGGAVESDVDSEWFYVRKKDGNEGFIPAEIAGHGYI